MRTARTKLIGGALALAAALLVTAVGLARQDGPHGFGGPPPEGRGGPRRGGPGGLRLWAWEPEERADATRRRSSLLGMVDDSYPVF